MTPRDAEIARYVALYAKWGKKYRTSALRRDLFDILLAERPELTAAGLLDVGAGQGAMLDVARARGVAPLAGTEVVPSLVRGDVVHAPAWALPFSDRAFGTVTCFDVLEHLLPDDVPAALREIGRVARDRILLEVSCRPSNWKDDAGQLHMTIWRPESWRATVVGVLGPRWDVTPRGAPLGARLEHGAALLEAVATSAASVT